MKDIQLYKNLDEIFTDERRSEIIRRVFENKTKTNLSIRKMKEGGKADESDVYTPYEFLHELLPKVYGRNYVVSDAEAERMTKDIEKEEAELNQYVLEQIQKFNVSRIYDISEEQIITDIEVRRKTLASRKIFISESEMLAYLYCHPEIDSKLYVKNADFNLQSLISKGLVMLEWEKTYFNQILNQQVEGTIKYVYRYEYLSGNLYKKLTNLQSDYTLIMESSGMTTEQAKIQLDKQIELLKANFPKQAEITLKDYNRINIHPNSTFADEIFYVKIDDWADEGLTFDGSLKRAFTWWLDYHMDITLLQKATKSSIKKYFIEIAKAEDSSQQNERRQAYSDGERIFPIFLNDAINQNCKVRLQYA